MKIELASDLDRLARDWFDANRPVLDAHLSHHIDGVDYMRRIGQLLVAASESDGLVLHSAWRITNVSIPMSKDNAEETLFDLLKRTRCTIYIRLSGHSFALSNLWATFRLRYRSVRERRVFVFMDQSFASWFGSYHQKSTSISWDDAGTVVLLGSIDLNKRRKDDRTHEKTRTNRLPSHDVGVEIWGEAAERIMTEEIRLWENAAYYRNRVLWPFRTSKRSIPRTRDVKLTPASGDRGRPGIHTKVQVVRTIPAPTRESSWMFFEDIATTFGEAYVRAVNTAKRYIYVEDQYFTPNFDDLGSLQWTHPTVGNLLDALKAAISRGVQVVVLVPSKSPNGPGIKQLRDRAIDGLRSFAAWTGQPLPIIVELATPTGRENKGSVDVHVHSKVLICDDEFALVGSGNVNARSFLNDVELGVAFVGRAAAALREDLLAEHLEAPSRDEWRAAFDQLRSASVAGTGRVRAYETDAPDTPPGKYRRLLWRLSEPSRS